MRIPPCAHRQTPRLPGRGRFVLARTGSRRDVRTSSCARHRMQRLLARAFSGRARAARRPGVQNHPLHHAAHSEELLFSDLCTFKVTVRCDAELAPSAARAHAVAPKSDAAIKARPANDMPSAARAPRGVRKAMSTARAPKREQWGTCWIPAPRRDCLPRNAHQCASSQSWRRRLVNGSAHDFFCRMRAARNVGADRQTAQPSRAARQETMKRIALRHSLIWQANNIQISPCASQRHGCST